MPGSAPPTSIKNVRAGHDVNGQIVNPVPVDFNLPLTISNAEDPEQQTPIALHVIVDNASEFPAGGGGGAADLAQVYLGTAICAYYEDPSLIGDDVPASYPYNAGFTVGDSIGIAVMDASDYDSHDSPSVS